MNTVTKLGRPDGKHGAYAIFCPACQCLHAFDDRWTFNGDYIKPTFKPSMFVNKNMPELGKQCHSFVTDGKIQFLSDCSHEMAGKTVALEPI